MIVNRMYKAKIPALIISILLVFQAFVGTTTKAAASRNTDLVSITINNQIINITNSWVTSYNLELPANTPDDILKVIGEPYDLNSTVSVEGNKLVNKSALVKITVTAEDKASKETYYVNVILKESSLAGGFTDIKTADFHSLALKNDGTLYGFGENEFGQLGDGTRDRRNRPVQVKGLANVVDFDTSNSHSAAITRDGSVWVWGLNDYGQLYSGNKSEVLSPIKVSGLQDIVKVRTGNRYNIALDKFGTVWTWGYNSKGQLEDEPEDAIMQPTVVKELKAIKDIETGDFHSLALSVDGSVYVWGANDYGQLGDGTSSNRYYPVKNSLLTDVRFINAKGNTSSCITGDGTAILWGESSYPENRKIMFPEEISSIGTPISIEANSNTIVQLNRGDNYAYSYGKNYYGQLGNGSYYDRDYFSSVYGAGKVKKISTSPYNIFVVSEDGYIYSAGRNELGQLGTGTAGQSISTVQKITEIADSQIERVYADKSSGEVEANTTIKLAVSTLGAKIFFTLDGSDPTEKSTLYEKPIHVTKYTVIKAIAVKSGKYSAVSTFQYIVKNAVSDMEVTIGTKSAVSGSIIEIPITFSNVPSTGISNLKFAVQFNPEILDLSTVTSGDIVKDSNDFSYSETSDGTLILSFSDSTKTSNNITKSGTFALLKMYLRNSQTLGKYSIVQVFTTGEGFYSKAYKKYNVRYNQGFIDTNLLYGDVDGDQKVTALDLQYVQRYVSNKLYYFPGSRGREAADMDRDGTIDSQDVELIKQRILKGE